MGVHHGGAADRCNNRLVAAMKINVTRGFSRYFRNIEITVDNTKIDLGVFSANDAKPLLAELKEAVDDLESFIETEGD